MAICSTSRRLLLCPLGLQLALAVVLVVLAGCSTAPIADIMDFWCPGRFPKDAKGAIGGVCVPQGGLAGGMLGPPQPSVTTPRPPAPPVGPYGPGEPPPPAPPEQRPV
jgi:hypothetical protein